MTDQQSKIIIYNTNDGKNYNVTFYSLEMILAVGYRVRGKRGYAKFDERRKKSPRFRPIRKTGRCWRKSQIKQRN